jgi:hypothetical protein
MSSFGLASPRVRVELPERRREDVLLMSQKERDRLVLLHQVVEGQLSMAEGARRAGLGTRQFRRLCRRFEAEGDRALVHGLRGRSSNRRLDPELREKALARAREPLYQDFGPTLLSEHLARDPTIGFVHPHTLRLWMIQDGCWTVRPRKQRHRKRRERRAAFGELTLIDTSIHPWLEERTGEPIVLIALIDDATGRLHARFFPRDTGAANRQILIDYLQRQGRMQALYMDQASHFRVNWRRAEREAKDLEAGQTLIQKALGTLGIEVIYALSPQAKGRVERLFKTLQDRLIKEMRVARISSLQEANRFLDEVFIPFWDARFGVEPRESTDAHRALPEGTDLLRLFAETSERVIRPDFTFRYKNQFYQIEAAEADSRMPSRRLTLERRVDASIRFRWEERYLSPRLLQEAPPAAPSSRTPTRAPVPPAPKPRPAPDHPWRTHPIAVGRKLFGPVVASAALRPDSPTPGETLTTSPP